MGALYVNDFTFTNGRTYRVQLQADAPFRIDPKNLGQVYVRTAKGQMIPVSALIKIESLVGPEQLERYTIYG